MDQENSSQSARENEINEPAKVPSDLVIKSALIRTAMASENTMLSWIRTAVSLYTFGFSIAKFFDYLSQEKGDARFGVGPHRLGIVLIGAGILSILLAMVGHVRVNRKLQELGMPIGSRLSLSIGTAIVLLVVGIVVLIGIAF